MGDGWFSTLVLLRAERNGAQKNGRTYSVNVEVVNENPLNGEWDRANASTVVVVPHNAKGAK
jgi:hypothetical protein